MFPMTLTLTDISELQAVMSVLNPTILGNKEPPAATKIAQPDAVVEPNHPKVEPYHPMVVERPKAVEQPKADLGEQKPDAPASSHALPEEVISYDQLAKVLLKFVSVKGKDMAVKVLAGFNASHLKGVAEKDYAALHEALAVKESTVV